MELLVQEHDTSRVIREKFNFRAPWQAGTQAMINPK